MEVTATRPVNEAAQLVAASLQNVRFKERRLREAQSDVRNEAVYFSPVIRIDRETSTAIIQYRDRATGEVEREYPAPPKEGAYKPIEAKPQPIDVPVEKVEIKAAPVEKPDAKASIEHVDESV